MAENNGAVPIPEGENGENYEAGPIPEGENGEGYEVDEDVLADFKENAEEIREGMKEYNEQVNKKIQEIDAQFQSTFQGRISDIESKYDTEIQHRVKSKQDNVLRTNKVIREVSRGLGEDWKIVFEYLMASYPKEVTQAEIANIEKQKPFMQAYKSLTIWKDMKGDELEIEDLVTALKSCGKMELADMASAILQSDEQSLLSINSVGKGIIHSGRPSLKKKKADGESAEAKPSAEEIRRGSIPVETQLAGPLGDRNILQLSRKIEGDWKILAQNLNIPEEEIGEIEEFYGESHQRAAFKVLHHWRDGLGDFETLDHQRHVPTLQGAFSRIKREDLKEFWASLPS